MALRQMSHHAFYQVEFCPVELESRPPVAPYDRNTILDRGHISGGLVDDYLPLGMRLVDTNGCRWVVYELPKWGRVLARMVEVDGCFLIEEPMTLMVSINSGSSLSKREGVPCED